MSLLISNALLYGVLLSAILAIVMGISLGIAPDMWVGDYPPDIKASYGEMSQRAKKYRPPIAILFFGSVLFISMLAISRLRILTQGNVGFWSYSLSAFITLMVFNLFDLLVVDWLIFVAVQPRSVILPGTEGMAGYKDYGFHFRGFLIGIGFSALGALIIATLALLSVRLFC